MLLQNNKKIEKISFSFCEKDIIFEIDSVANKSDKTVVCRYGGTIVLTTLCSKKNDQKKGKLSIFVEERLYSISKIPFGFNRREGRPSYESILASRVADRSLRPVFIQNSSEDFQIVNTIISADPNFDPKLVICWNSFLVSALSGNLSEIVSVVSVAKVDGILICNPSFKQLKNSEFEIFVAFSKEKVFMIECFCNNLSNEDFQNAFNFAFEKSKLMIKEYEKNFFFYFPNFQYQKTKKYEIFDKKQEALIKNFEDEIFEILNSSEPSNTKENLYKSLQKNILLSDNDDLINETFEKFLKKEVSKKIKLFGLRIDNRKIDEIREIKIVLDYIPSSHGSCLFSRGATEVLSVVTFGRVSEKKTEENSAFYSIPKNFIHHYNFPSFSVGEVSITKNTSRREIGHGNLVEKTFLKFVPSLEDFPYTTRIVSEVLSAEGSSSQASICSSSLALMSSGFNLKFHVAGVALGFLDGNIIADIDELEDRIGDADFKISGTKIGICSLQLDTKKNAINVSEINNFLDLARKSRILIIEKMEKEIDKPRDFLNFSVLKCKKIYIGKEKMKFIIGQKGKVIDSIISKTSVRVEFKDDGYAFVYHSDNSKIEIALEIISEIINRH